MYSKSVLKAAYQISRHAGYRIVRPSCRTANPFYNAANQAFPRILHLSCGIFYCAVYLFRHIFYLFICIDGKVSYRLRHGIPSIPCPGLDTIPRIGKEPPDAVPGIFRLSFQSFPRIGEKGFYATPYFFRRTLNSTPGFLQKCGNRVPCFFPHFPAKTRNGIPDAFGSSFYAVPDTFQKSGDAVPNSLRAVPDPFPCSLQKV